MSEETNNRRRPGPESESLKINLPWEEAVRRAMAVRVPPGGIPERVTQKRERAKPKRHGA